MTCVCRWGCIAARYLFLVLIAGLGICSALSAGIYFAQTISDTDDLWFGPDSNTRTYKNYFDETFA